MCPQKPSLVEWLQETFLQKKNEGNLLAAITKGSFKGSYGYHVKSVVSHKQASDFCERQGMKLITVIDLTIPEDEIILLATEVESAM